jgi:DNA-binding LytR/AlgR family response regulator
MRVIIEDIGPEEEEQLILRCREVDESLLKLINSFKQGGLKLTVGKDGRWFRVNPKDVYYIESVDNKVFVYTSKDCMEIRQKLYTLEELLAKEDFYRISKSVIVNLDKMKSLSPAFSGRMEATLINEEKLIISRQYVSRLREVLNL